ncbi:hypothetical protein B0G80_2857 [Paraburkholderia sp. BL6669N2]|nr:hypothetical protein B0G80_2857 [Paraburkholderia sp. BL6669N2]
MVHTVAESVEPMIGCGVIGQSPTVIANVAHCKDSAPTMMQCVATINYSMAIRPVPLQQSSRDVPPLQRRRSLPLIGRSAASGSELRSDSIAAAYHRNASGSRRPLPSLHVHNSHQCTAHIFISPRPDNQHGRMGEPVAGAGCHRCRDDGSGVGTDVSDAALESVLTCDAAIRSDLPQSYRLRKMFRLPYISTALRIAGEESDRLSSHAELLVEHRRSADNT